MNLVSFNLFRTLGLPVSTHLKPEATLKDPAGCRASLTGADWVLFPEYWQLNSLLYGYGCRVFPSEASYRIGHNKVEMTRAFQAVVPEHLPHTLIAANTSNEAEAVWEQLTLPFVAKLPKASMGNGVWLIENRDDWQHYLQITDVIYAQEYLPIDRDLRIVVVGGELVTAYWRHQSDRSFHTNVSRGGEISFGDIPSAATDLALKVAHLLNIDHAGFDIAMVGEHPYLFEFNRLFGNQGIPGGGKTLSDAILRHLQKHMALNDAIATPLALTGSTAPLEICSTEPDIALPGAPETVA